jgi:hypothetical protein
MNQPNPCPEPGYNEGRDNLTLGKTVYKSLAELLILLQFRLLDGRRASSSAHCMLRDNASIISEFGN